MAITIDGIDAAIENLNYRNKNSPKYKMISAIRDIVGEEGSLAGIKQIDSEALIKKIWDVGDDPRALKSKQKNLNSIRSTVNADLSKMFEQDKNPEGVSIGAQNTFVMSDEAKNKFFDSVSSQNSIPMDKLSDIMDLVNILMDKIDSKSDNEVSKLKELLEDLSDDKKLVDADEDEDDYEVVEEDDEDYEIEEIDDEDEEIVEVDEDEEIEEIDDDEFEEIEEEDDDFEIEEVDDDEYEIEEIDDEDEEIVELDEDEEIEEVDDDEFEEIDEEDEIIEMDEDEEIEEIDDDEYEIEEIDDEDEEIIEMDEDDEIEEVDEDEFEEIDEEDEIIELDEDEEIEEIEEDDEDYEIEEIDDEDEEIVEIDEDEEIEEIDDDEFDDIDEEDEIIEMDEDDEIEEIDDEDEEVVELDEDEEIEEVDEDDFEEIDDVPELGLPIEDAEDYETEEKEDGEAGQLLKEQFDGFLGAMERFYNQYLLIPTGKYIIGSPEPSQIELSERTVTLMDYYISKFPITNSLFEVFVDKTGYRTTAEEVGFGTVYSGRVQKIRDPRTGQVKNIWNSTYGKKIVKGACWYQPGGTGTTLYNKRNHPVVQVSMRDIDSFTAWTGKQLPSEFEWEAAARTGAGNPVPWGSQWEEDGCNVEELAISDTTPVDHFPKSENEFGVADTLGNILEWTSDLYEPKVKPKRKIRFFIVKGGSFVSDNNIRLYSRFFFDENFTANIIGFRCITI